VATLIHTENQRSYDSVSRYAIPGKGQPPRRTSQAGLYLDDQVIISLVTMRFQSLAAAPHAIIFDRRMAISITAMAMSHYVQMKNIPGKGQSPRTNGLTNDDGH